MTSNRDAERNNSSQRRGSRGDQRSRAQPDWLTYEEEVADLVASLDEGATVQTNQQVWGRISGVRRQLDALVTGEVASQVVAIAIEAKLHQRRVSIGKIDEFIGKILDVGCDRGVIYAAGGFTDGALSRASYARNPAIGCVHLTPVEQSGEEPDLFAMPIRGVNYRFAQGVDIYTDDYRVWLESEDSWFYREEDPWYGERE